MNNPFALGLPPNLVPNPPPDMPEAPGPGDAAELMSAFSEPQDVESIKARLKLDRPLKLFIPDREKYAEDFRIINSIPQEIADAKNHGWEPATRPELVRLFEDLVAGTDKNGKAFRPLLFARSKAVTAHIEKLSRQKKASLYAGMDPRNKDMNGRYTGNVSDKDGTKGQFSGPGFRIRV